MSTATAFALLSPERALSGAKAVYPAAVFRFAASRRFARAKRLGTIGTISRTIKKMREVWQ